MDGRDVVPDIEMAIFFSIKELCMRFLIGDGVLLSVMWGEERAKVGRYLVSGQRLKCKLPEINPQRIKIAEISRRFRF